MSLIRDEVLAAAHRGRELIAAGTVALAGLWLNRCPGWPMPGKTVPIWLKGIAGTGGSGNAPRFPRPCATVPPGPSPPAPKEGSARPGGGEAPADGGAGAGRGLWPPAGLGVSAAMWQGRWPLPMGRGWGSRSDLSPHVRAGSGNAPRFPALPHHPAAHANPAPAA